ncbi:uncharacterized protein LOC123543813 [Mercenaria mercenaria]|uniref:uncharacterized protein LOC123543813 n=1 Tax=Mercenaria mercenaria TaxID=6596 RepID=UPI00234F4E10|nr:uncharacterized protein LOC123543813 [Mercenaria mercenaria]
MAPPLYSSKFKNWIKAGLGVLYTKEGIEPFVYDEIKQFQQQCLSDICSNNGLVAGTICSSCCTENVIVCPTKRICNKVHGECDFHRNSATQYLQSGCPNKICHNFKKEIQNSHRFYRPSYKNTDSSQWCRNPWEVAKCFMPPDGYKEVTSVAETDFNGIVSVIINNKVFQSKVKDDLSGKSNIFEQGREVGKAVRHSAKLEIEDTDLQQYFSILLNLLSDPAHLSSNTAAQNAKTKLLQLQNDTLVIGKDDIRNVLDGVAKEVQGKIRTEIDEQKTEAKNTKSELFSIKNESVEAINNKKTLSIAHLDKALESAINDLEKQTKESLEKVLDIGKEQIGECADKGVSMLEVRAEDGVKQIEKAVDKGIDELEVGVAKISAKAEEALKQIAESAPANKEGTPTAVEDETPNLFQRIYRWFTYPKRTEETPKAVDEPPNLFQRIYGWFTYPKRKEELKDDLIDLYRERHHTLPMSPLMEENDTPLLKFYVMPDIESVEIERARGGGKEIRSKVTSLHDVFYKEKEPCRKIYLAADAGFGKTALSKRLVLTWCQAKNCIPNEDEHFKKKDISTMSNFDFVFLLSLRDCSEEWDIDEMIKKQITNDLAHIISNSDFENILSKERCLIILDGLDEFTHAKSDIPHRKARRKCTILTTTRPWKLGVSKIRASEIERKLELIGLSKTSAKSLKRTVISLLCGKTDIEKHIQEFDRAISDRGISDLETIPLLLMYLLCLWCDGIELGASRTELYCQTIELLLKRTFEKYPDMQQSREQSQSDIPQCFSEHEHCKEHYTFLQALGQLAFETLFSENKESTLVFSQSVTEKHLTPEYLKLSLNSGMLTQSTEKTLTKQISKFSFSHKTVHEFFCALYISCQNESDVKNIVLNKCKSLQSILDMSTVLVFISGMNTKIISSISQEFLSVISEDKITSEYRSTTARNCEPLKDIQDMYISCMKENTSDKELKLFCQDFFFSEDCKEEKYFTYLARLAVQNKNNMASINIDTEDSGRSLREIIDCCELHELFQINKIYYNGKVENAQLPVLLDKSPKCVTVISPFGSRGSWSREMLETLQNNSLLQAIYIYWFKMSHDVLNDFLNYIINRKTMTEIRLGWLDCTEHWPSCTFSLDFSQHSDLRKLELCWIPEVSQLKVNSKVKHVQLGGINLGEMSLPPEMANIERVYLYNVNMSASTLRDLVKVVEKLSHKVTVTIETSVR